MTFHLGMLCCVRCDVSLQAGETQGQENRWDESRRKKGPPRYVLFLSFNECAKSSHHVIHGEFLGFLELVFFFFA